MIAALPKDFSQMGVETFKALLHTLSVLTVNQTENYVADSVGIRPLLHFQCKLKLSLAHF